MLWGRVGSGWVGNICPIGQKGGLVGIDEWETCPAGLGRGKHAFGGWLSLVRLGLGCSTSS